MRISDWSSDVCSSDLIAQALFSPLQVADVADDGDQAAIGRAVALSAQPVAGKQFGIDRLAARLAEVLPQGRNIGIDVKARREFGPSGRGSSQHFLVEIGSAHV